MHGSLNHISFIYIYIYVYNQVACLPHALPHCSSGVPCGCLQLYLVQHQEPPTTIRMTIVQLLLILLLVAAGQTFLPLFLSLPPSSSLPVFPSLMLNQEKYEGSKGCMLDICQIYTYTSPRPKRKTLVRQNLHDFDLTCIYIYVYIYMATDTSAAPKNAKNLIFPQFYSKKRKKKGVVDPLPLFISIPKMSSFSGKK